MPSQASTVACWAMSDAPELHLRQVNSDLDEAFVLRLAPSFLAFPLPAWRRHGESLRGLRAALDARLQDGGHEGHLLLAEDEQGERVGFLSLSLTRDYFSDRRQAHLNELAVAPEHRRRGFGRALLDHAERWARARGCHALSLNVFPGNEAARRLYDGAGYQLDLLRLAKPLS